MSMLLNKRKIEKIPPLLIFAGVLCFGRGALGQIILDTTPTVSRGEVLISELLFDPAVGGADYVELYNSSSLPVDLGQLFLVRWEGGTMRRFHPLPQGQMLAPQHYACLTTDKAWVMTHYTVCDTGSLHQLASMPPYPQGSGTVLLALADSTVIDRFDYDVHMHSPLLRDSKGVALERCSFWGDSGQPATWTSAASSAGFGTPTCANSASLGTMGGTLISLSSTLISPDGDGYNDQLVITYSMPQDDMLARLELYDAAGRCVRSLFSGTLATQGQMVWDGRDNSGQALPAGSYLLLVRTSPSAGRRYWETNRFTVNIWK